MVRPTQEVDAPPTGRQFPGLDLPHAGHVIGGDVQIKGDLAIDGGVETTELRHASLGIADRDFHGHHGVQSAAGAISYLNGA